MAAPHVNDARVPFSKHKQRSKRHDEQHGNSLECEIRIDVKWVTTLCASSRIQGPTKKAIPGAKLETLCVNGHTVERPLRTSDNRTTISSQQEQALILLGGKLHA